MATNTLALEGGILVSIEKQAMELGRDFDILLIRLYEYTDNHDVESYHCHIARRPPIEIRDTSPFEI